jgi:hypothetical protein
LGILLSLNDQDLTNAMQTFFAKDRNADKFFILVEEKIKRKLETKSCEKLFFSLLHTHNYDRLVIGKFLKIINQDEGYVITSLAELNAQAPLLKYVMEISKYQEYSIPNIMAALIDSYQSGRVFTSQYLVVMSEIIARSKSFAKELLHGHNRSTGIFLKSQNIQEKFENYIVSSKTRYMFNMPVGHASYLELDLIRNYCFYLHENEPGNLDQFENRLLNTANVELVYQFGMHVPLSNPRKVLKKLVEFKNESYLVSFIKQFPEFNSLLPML